MNSPIDLEALEIKLLSEHADHLGLHEESSAPARKTLGQAFRKLGAYLEACESLETLAEIMEAYDLDRARLKKNDDWKLELYLHFAEQGDTEDDEEVDFLLGTLQDPDDLFTWKSEAQQIWQAGGFDEVVGKNLTPEMLKSALKLVLPVELQRGVEAHLRQQDTQKNRSERKTRLKRS